MLSKHSRMEMLLDGAMRCSSVFVGSCRDTWHDRKHQVVFIGDPSWKQMRTNTYSCRLQHSWDVIAQQDLTNVPTFKRSVQKMKSILNDIWWFLAGKSRSTRFHKLQCLMHRWPPGKQNSTLCVFDPRRYHYVMRCNRFSDNRLEIHANTTQDPNVLQTNHYWWFLEVTNIVKNSCGSRRVSFSTRFAVL